VITGARKVESIMATTDEQDTTRATNDAYTGMLAISLIALIIGCLLLFLDWSQYPSADPPKVKAPPPVISAPPADKSAPGAGDKANVAPPVQPMQPMPMPMN
jgi:hypothetical protein